MADRSQGILLDSSVIIARFRGKLDLFQLISPDEPLFMPLVAHLSKMVLSTGLRSITGTFPTAKLISNGKKCFVA